MKNPLYQFMVLCAISILSILMMTGCQNNSLSDEDIQKETIPNIGVLHNEILDNIFENLMTSATRSDKISAAEFQALCITEACKSVIEKDSSLNLQDVEDRLSEVSTLSVEDIKAHMDENDRYVIDAISQMLTQEITGADIREYILSSNLDEQKTQAALAFYETYEESKSYWKVNKETWINYIQTNVALDEPMTRGRFGHISWGQVIFADAYYGWYFMVSSGCNIVMGAGGAALGSAFTALGNMYH